MARGKWYAYSSTDDVGALTAVVSCSSLQGNMSLFDHYRPGDDIRCPACSRELREWQGKDGPNGLLVWAEGTRHPVDQLVDEDVQLELAEREQRTLPERFVIYSYDCSLHHPVYADCSAPGGTWRDTAIRPLEETPGHVDSRVRDRTVR